MSANADQLKTLSVSDLTKAIFEGTGITAPDSTLRGLRSDLEWPRFRKKPTKLYTRVDRLEETVSYLVNQLNIDLPERLK